MTRPDSPARRPADGPPGADPRFHVTVICSGNICRSPIAEHVLRSAVQQAGLADQVRVTSGGTGDWHVGQAANARAVRVLEAHGLPTDHVARQITVDDLDTADLVLAADRGHLRSLRRMLAAGDPGADKVRLLRSFDPEADSDEVPDPYYGPDSGFDEVMAMTLAAAPGVIDEIRSRLVGETPGGGRP
ncbi:low molecular weight protein-tyrosine-phosphatase [Nakamurella leprariae]|uniref:protein-tyrosine-phosphatase n=1 Tax=Nakamurella leprariae TaxID=2803911 RepID=A0A938YF15_9ACTN|nr:low molecular weight protein-tyrosine-phosphatase [Nakamurella leprariae]MBM9466964.1 low molecular weight phosphotyrosine protein phosphatase [Nakamurella leprariae]